ncbi:MAG TPA: cytochrome c3 family protein [Candidatus Eisenbacteria bacterium]|nr:cytochrome c3 family protein [Candidatus Eisenbacteria bacterium]
MRDACARVFAAAALLAAALLPAGAARAQVSPGPLAAAHQELDTLAKCFACHSRSESMTQRCVACHGEIAWSRSARRGLHARPEFADCASCHPDHAGRGFAMISWEEGSAERFRHDRTGYALEGSHAVLRCAQCHTPAKQKSAVARRIKMKDRSRSYLGLERACASCHADPHAGRFGLACETCHKVSAWKDLDSKKFNHEWTRYPLRGRHAAVACADCHDETRAWGKKPRFDRCDACHKDAHAGKATLAGRAADCSACHDVSGFAPSSYTAAMHAKSAYPLEGKHRAAACAGCHAKRPAGVPASSLGSAGVLMRPRHDACGDCHGAPHGSQLAVAPAKGAATKGGRARKGGANDPEGCLACHDLQGFKPTRYSVAAHATTAFPLEGAHAKAACRVCHDARRAELQPLRDPQRFGPAGFAMNPAERACADCHSDPHKGRFVAGCADCHGNVSFRPARLGVAEHERTKFPLRGAHRAVPCVDCHGELKREPPRSTLVRAARRPADLTFAVAKQACADCHKSPHGDQFDRPAASARACERCHGVDVFHPASRFDHARDTAFPLDGAHRGVACAKCHAADAAVKGARVVRYRGVSTKCETCHPVTGAKR